MTTRRDFPSTTVGRAAGSHLSSPNPNPSHEPLSAHPLLSPSSSPEGHPHPASPETPPKYVPYTPRQRPSSTHVVSPPLSATTGATVHSSPVSALGGRGVGEAAGGGGEGTAMGKLQMMNLKVAARDVGLDVGSVGWAILEKLVEEGGECGQGQRHGHSTEWCDVWATVTTGKATLLLPLEHASAHEKITVEFVKDHVVYCEGSARSNAPVITLSGLRGTLNAETLTFRSSLHPSSKAFHNLVPPLTRSSFLSSLPPLPVPVSYDPHSPTLFATLSPHSPLTQPPSSPHPHPTQSTSTHPSYPNYTLRSYCPTLPLPPVQKPPLLPPRPSATTAVGGRPSASPLVATTSSRLSLPFASLFGKSSPAVPVIGPAPPGVHAATGRTSPSPTPSGVGAAGGTAAGAGAGTGKMESDHIMEVAAFTVDRKIVRADVCREVNRTLREEVRGCLQEGLLEDEGEEVDEALEMPVWVVERVQEFVEGMMPFVELKSSNRTGTLGKGGVFGVRNRLGAGKEGGRDNDVKGINMGTGEYEVNRGTEAPEQTSEKFQEFYAALEQDLRVDGSSFRRGGGDDEAKHHVGDLGERSAKAGDGAGEQEETAVGMQRRVEERLEGEARIRDVVECVERIICELFYDRLFLQHTSDDASHDEALSSRVAALNMLDLGLEHLDVQVPTGRCEELDAVVRACGETLSQLDAACRAPADKAAVLVAAHKIVVGKFLAHPVDILADIPDVTDGLSKLPPIRLKSEEDTEGQKTATMSDKHLGMSTGAENPLRADAIDTPVGVGVDDLPLSPADVPVVSPSPTSPLPSRSDSLPSSDLQGPVTADMHPKPSPAPSAEATPVSGDILLPMIIFSVVKANPPHLVSHLLFTQRFRNQSVGGEESYSLINLMAVAEFLENVDLEALGLGDSENKVMSASELTPIPINRSPKVPDAPSLPQEGSLRGRMEQQVDAIAGSANKVITGVMDSSFGVLRLLLPSTPPELTSPRADGAQGAAPWNAVRPGFGLLRREAGFSIASIAASLPGSNRSKSGHAPVEETGQPLVVVSRPGSVRSAFGGDEEGEESGDASDRHGREEESEASGDEAEGDDEGEHDARSIRSFESMMSGKGKDRRGGTRKSLTDRLAHMSGLARLKSDDAAHKGSPLSHRPPLATRLDTPVSSNGQSPVTIRLAPPNQRFVECLEDDIRVSEVGELLREYRRVVEGLRAMGGFEE